VISETAFFDGWTTRFRMVILCGFLFLPVVSCIAQTDWESLKPAIEKAMRTKDTVRLRKLWAEARIRRGFDLGKADVEVFYNRIDSSGADPAEVEKAWSLCLDNLMAWELQCPEPSTETPLALLGLCYAQVTGNQLVPAEKSREIIRMLLAQQFDESRKSPGSSLQTGSFGMLVSGSPDSCGFSGPLQKNILSTAKKYPDWTLRYSSGPFAGLKFLVADQGPRFEKTEAWMGNHMYWSVAECLAFNRVFPDSSVIKAALLAGNWLRKEEPVTGFHVNARLISALALLYGETGNPELRNRLIWLLEAGLGPGQLLDEDRNGLADSTLIPFDSLQPYARVPGRFFDPQNASAWNTAICANAMLQAYLAFQRQGDLLQAEKWKMRTTAALENLCCEICNLGLPPAGSGFRDLAYVIFEALNHMKKPSSGLQSRLEKSARIIWNSGIMQSGNFYAVNLGQMILWLKRKK
jgi:hypothetical protein